MLKKDNWILGIILGIVLPVAIYLLVYMAMMQWGQIEGSPGRVFMKKSTMQLIGIFSNMFTFRYYMVNLKYDKTGRGILLITFVWAGIFIYQNMA